MSGALFVTKCELKENEWTRRVPNPVGDMAREVIGRQAEFLQSNLGRLGR